MSKRTQLGLFVLSLLFALLVPLVASGATQRATLRYGSTGSDVKVMQTKLKDWGYYKGRVDGVYGWRTLQAIRSFQWKHGLTGDGIVGPRTWSALGEWGGATKAATTAAKPAAPAPATGGGGGGDGGGGGGTTTKTSSGNTGNTALRQSEKHLLAQITSAESKGEPYEGQVAVASTILNRIKDPRFPNTLQGVVFEAGAFEPVANGTIYNPPTESAVRAAQDALNGWDPTDGALYFWNPVTAKSKWIWSRTITMRIGKHVFGK